MAEAAKALTLQQKFVKLREAIPKLTKKKHSDGVKYAFIKIFDIYEVLTPAMNEYGVNFEIINETATRHDELGNALYYHNYQQNTRNGERTVWVYEADITFRWINADNPEDFQDVTLHALGTNDGGPDKAKGSAWTYAIKYYFFEKFGVDQGEDDPDNTDLSGNISPDKSYGSKPGYSGSGGTNSTPNNKTASNGPKKLSDAQLTRLYNKAKDAGHDQQKVNDRIAAKYGAKDPHDLTREQYDEICAAFDEAAAKT